MVYPYLVWTDALPEFCFLPTRYISKVSLEALIAFRRVSFLWVTEGRTQKCGCTRRMSKWLHRQGKVAASQLLCLRVEKRLYQVPWEGIGGKGGDGALDPWDCRNPELICLSPASRNWLVAWLTRAIQNAGNEPALAPMTESRIEDTLYFQFCYCHNCQHLPHSHSWRWRVLILFQLPKLRVCSDDNRNENTADAIILKWLVM